MKKIIKYVTADILRNKIVLAYTVLLLIISFSVFALQDDASKGMLSLLNITLLIVPLMSVIFSAIYIYNSAEFIELLVSQPLKRKSIWLSLFYGLAAALSIAYFIGAGIPIIIYQPSATGFIMLGAGIILSIIFVAIALLAAVLTRDKAKGIGITILLWLYFALIFDGLILFILFQFEDYPLDKFMVFTSAFNPVDLCRILILLRMDVSALMGYTGAIFKDFFGSQTGSFVAVTVLLLWVIIPVWLSMKKFKKKDL
ncbi:ABC transporter permease subunit [Parafilimonas terrae]|uniref:Cu-processing system permease protein n=1 Tax=Parafilimonas terrae TaxID=1465490 RepID=A0A1I5TQX5_9BACT|nr:ABC transporter permease subunit [Parafilimonas terrae]SFP85472.1 Cu-processing system permease protein [Parafilimonas terrae]